MWRYLTTITLVLGLGVVLFPELPHHRTKPGPEVYSAKYETTSKLALLEQDVKLTDELCRSQCAIDYMTMLNQIEGGEPATNVLKNMRNHHEKMDLLVWSKRGQNW